MPAIHRADSLLESLRTIGDLETNLRIQCRDGEVFISRLLLAIASPTLRNLLVEEEEAQNLLVPDVSVESCRVAAALLQLKHPAIKGEHLEDLKETLELLMIESRDFGAESSIIAKQDSVKEEVDDRVENGTKSETYIKNCHEASHKCSGCKRVLPDTAQLEACQTGHLFLYSSQEQKFMCRVSGCGFAHHERRKMLIHERAKHRPDFLLPGINTPRKCDYLPTSVVCHICSKQVSQRNIQAHTAKHTGEKPFVCDICAYRTYSKAYFRHHTRVKHTEMDRFTCHICTRRLQTKIALSQHLLIHTGEKPHVCDHCGKRYRHLVDFKKHTYIHLDGGPEKCQFCEKTFPEKRRLAFHIMQHHTAERPHKCATCSAAFATRKGLNKHEKTHSAERPFVCGTCSQAYKARSHLSKHQKSHHAHASKGAWLVNCSEST